MKVWYVVNGDCRIISISRHNVISVVFLLHILMTWSHQWSIWLSLGSPRRFSVSMFTSKECTMCICNFLFADDWALMSQMRFTFQDQALVSMVAAYFGFFRLYHGEDGWSFGSSGSRICWMFEPFSERTFRLSLENLGDLSCLAWSKAHTFRWMAEKTS